jgi:hypothetical protein
MSNPVDIDAGFGGSARVNVGVWAPAAAGDGISLSAKPRSPLYRARSHVSIQASVFDSATGTGHDRMNQS